MGIFDETSGVGNGKVYYIRAVKGEPDWDSIPEASIDTVLWTEDTGTRARGQLCRDDENLYVHLRAAEREIRAENTRQLSPVWEDSCLEFFFKTGGSDIYFNFEINPNGCLCLQAGPARAGRFNIVREDAAAYFRIRTGRTEDGWEVFYRIPAAFLRLFCPGYRFEGEMYGNMYKCGDKTARPHYLSWSPIALDTPNFHCPEYFGKLIFG